ncbi:amidotransferase-related protein [Vibrio ishigakensis]|uniref:Amidotransferase-related protein n=1 Tax=Vibrio ishigakensis TaxID=1481914 RepID=A0A0B8NS80_9VIBR|nr:amidotransferase-related protein [Vibrio ishigakensis]
MTVGTETQGSINAPAEMSSVVGFKPSMGLVSRDNVIPLASSQDSPGPIAKSVGDVARLLNILSDLDSSDPLYAEISSQTIPDYTQFLSQQAYQSFKVAVLESSDSQWQKDIAQTLTSAGVQFEFVKNAPNANAPRLDVNCEFKYEFADMAIMQDMPQYSVNELVQYNNDFSRRRAAWGQEGVGCICS